MGALALGGCIQPSKNPTIKWGCPVSNGSTAHTVALGHTSPLPSHLPFISLKPYDIWTNMQCQRFRDIDNYGSKIYSWLAPRVDPNPVSKPRNALSSGRSGHRCPLRLFWAVVVMHTCDPSMWEAEAGRSQFQDQPGLHSERPVSKD